LAKEWGMTDKTSHCAGKICSVLGEMGKLNLWEARAILGESREFTDEVLHGLAARGVISYFFSGDQLLIAFARTEGGARLVGSRGR
jgi:hypothetical protein